MSDDIGVPKEILDEYRSIDETSCACGATAFVVVRQRLMQTPAGHSDWIDAKCRACGAMQTFVFPLPSFGQNARSKPHIWKLS